jgi:3-phosphoshikimate 1-carboxyvinyltransferase
MNGKSDCVLIVTPGNPLQGEIDIKSELSLPGDKSISHRAALFASLAEGVSEIDNFQVSGVTMAMLEALTVLGVQWGLSGNHLQINGLGLDRQAGTDSTNGLPIYINCGNSGTTLRLLAGAVAALGLSATIDGSPGLRRRPMNRIVEPLKLMGVAIEATDGKAPLRLDSISYPPQAIEYTMRVASAQVKSCLLLAALAAEGTTTIIEPGPSRDHSERMLRSMGVVINSERKINPKISTIDDKLVYVTRITAPKPLKLSPLKSELPGDISAAAFLIVGALITPESNILLRNVGLNPTRTGLLEALLKMGANIEISSQVDTSSEPRGDITVRTSSLKGVQISGSLVVRMIDEFPVLAVAAAYAEGSTIVSGANELRHKESDRISAMCAELYKLGVQITEKPDGFVIQGGESLNGGEVNHHGDHRLAMALSIAGLGTQSPVIVTKPEIISESFPNFTAILNSLGADVRLVD